MNRKIRVGAVNYLNTKPLIYGFEQGEMNDKMELLLDYPSRIATMLKNEEIDIGLVPVSIIPDLPAHYIISNYCIGCDGEVASVCLFSEVPLKEIKKILLDYQSRTSVALLKILIKEYWQITPVIEEPAEEFLNEIKNTTAGLIIGDRALEQRKRSTFIYDLGAEWKKFTGRPFVFAAWIANKQLGVTFIKNFNRVVEKGLNHLDEVIADNTTAAFDLKTYFTKNIKYKFANGAEQEIDFFLKKLKQQDSYNN